MTTVVGSYLADPGTALLKEITEGEEPSDDGGDQPERTP